jgi:hypothetical protein
MEHNSISESIVRLLSDAIFVKNNVHYHRPTFWGVSGSNDASVPHQTVLLEPESVNGTSIMGLAAAPVPPFLSHAAYHAASTANESSILVDHAIQGSNLHASLPSSVAMLPTNEGWCLQQRRYRLSCPTLHIMPPRRPMKVPYWSVKRFKGQIFMQVYHPVWPRCLPIKRWNGTAKAVMSIPCLYQ